MSLRRASILGALIALLCSYTGAQNNSSQTTASPKVNTDCLAGSAKDLKKILSRPDTTQEERTAKQGAISRLLQRWPVYVCYLATDTDVSSALRGVAEDKRQDKQPGASSSSSGSTSLVNKGSSPWLFGFALEHGGLTQTTNGNTVTLHGNVANSIKALLKSSYLASYELGEDDALIRYFSKLSFGVSFDTTADQGSSSAGFSASSKNVSGFSGKYEIVNHRDPRDKRWRSRWHELSTTVGLDFTNSAGELGDVLRDSNAFANWRTDAVNAAMNLPANATDDQIQKVIQDAADAFGNTFGNNADVTNAIKRLTTSISDYVRRENTVFSDIRTTPVITLQYDFVRQSVPAGQNITSAQPNQSIPDLSSVTLVLEKGFKGTNAPELTFNAIGTWFNSNIPGNPHAGRVRDYRASVQMDVPLKEIQDVGQPTLSFSGQFLSLINEPLGQKVMLNGVTVDRRGNVGVFQAKLSIPVKDSGVKIPIAFTYANRTEFIKEKDVRGNVGITLDLDSLFSKSK